MEVIIMFNIFKKKQEKPNIAIIVAAGSGTRMNMKENKAFVELAGIPVIAHSLIAMQKSTQIDEIIVVTKEENILLAGDIAKEFGIDKLKKIVPGGQRRQDSVYIAIKEAENANIIAIHDAARPCISIEDIDVVVKLADKRGAVTLAMNVSDTLKRVQDGVIVEEIDRHDIWAMQTPQAFRNDIIMRAHENAAEKDIQATDDAYLVQQLGIPVYIESGSRDNIKITEAEDLVIAEGILGGRENV